ncbi:acyltransferase family protein [Halovulum sp. GXIMD14794]
MQYRADIDGLRAVAVLPVVLFHAGFPGFSGGYVGVDVFFVISGYLITSLIREDVAAGRFTLANFYRRRARRILPALAAVVAFSLLAGYFLLLPGDFNELGSSALATGLFLSNVYFLNSLDYFGTSAEFAILLHTWSLAVEEQFYIFYPLLLVALLGRYGRAGALWSIAGLSVLSFLAAVVALPRIPDSVFYLIFFRAWELGAGACVALVRAGPPRRRRVRFWLGLVGLLAILLPATLYDARTPFPGLAALPPVLGTAVLIWAGGNGKPSGIVTLLSWRAFVWVGLISYSLYLWHWPILAFLRNAYGGVFLPLTVKLAAVAAAFAAAWLSYRYIEAPFRHRDRPVRKAAAPMIATAGAVVMLAGGMVYLRTSGAALPDKASALDIIAAAEDRNPRRAECFGKLPEVGLCQIGVAGETGAPVDFLFWGDSHAAEMLPGIDLAARNAGRRGLFVGQIACPPIPAVRRQPADRDCSAMNQAVAQFLAERDDLGLVILAARWPLSVEGETYGGEAERTVVLEWAGDPKHAPAADGNPALVEAGLLDLAESLRLAGRDVVLLGPTPEVGWNVPRVTFLNSLLGWPELGTLSRSDYDRRAGRSEAILARVAASNPNVEYVSLADLFCDQYACALHDEHGVPLFVDDDHISSMTARRLLPAVGPKIWEGPEG